jgi:hypothetical protein
MLRSKLACVAMLSVIAANAMAQDYACPPTPNSYSASNCWHNYWVMWRRNNIWPEPFIYPDRASICNFNTAQINKGWEAQCLLGEPHFEADGTKLSPAGMTKLRSILTQAPMQYRNVYVQRGMTEEITAHRLAAAQQASGEVMSGPVPEVLVSNMQLNSMPADYVNGVNTWFGGYMQGIAKPQPTAFTNDSNSSGGGGSP